MTCIPGQSTELPSQPACDTLTVRRCLTVGGVEVTGAVPQTDNVTLQGDGSALDKIRIKQVQHGANLAGDGTVATPINVANALDQSAAGKSLVVGDFRGAVIADNLNADQNDYAPAGYASATFFRLTPIAALRIITGLQGGVAGRQIYISNPAGSGQNLYLYPENVASAAANRFKLADGNGGSSGYIIVEPGCTIQFWYDGTLSRWSEINRANAYNFTAANILASGYQVNCAGQVNTSTIAVTTVAYLSILSLFGTSTIIAGNVNDWTPNSFNISTFVYLAPTAPWNITGMTGGFANRYVMFHNPTAFAVTLTHQDAASAAANRFTCPGAIPYVLAAGKTVAMVHNGASWLLLVQ